MMIICAKLFLNPYMHNKVMGRTRTGFTEVDAQSLSADCDLDFDLVIFLFVTHRRHDDHLCHIIFKSDYVCPSYGPDTILEYTNTLTHTHTWTG